MHIGIIYAQALLLLSYLALVNAVKVDIKGTSVIETVPNLWKPSNAIQFSNTTFCFQALNGTLETPFPSEQLLCSLNKGSSFITVNSSLPFCGGRGIISDGQLYCPHKKVNSKKGTSLRYSTIVFAPKNETIEGSISSQELSFQTKPNIVLEEIKFNGGLQYISSEGFYLMVATIVNSSNFESPYLFKSMNGFDWTVMEELPLNGSDEMYLHVQRDTKITVVAKNNRNYHKVTSEDMGKLWSSAEYLNTTSPPFSIMYPSNVVVEYSMSNHTRGELVFLSPLPQKNGNSFVRLNIFNQSAKRKKNAKKDISTSYYAVPMQVSSSPLQFIVVHDEVIQDTFSLLSTLIEIDDSEEKKYLNELVMQALEKAKNEKLRKEKARQENLRMKFKMQKKLLEADQIRRRKFADYDRPYIERASENMKQDKEFIVVRQVNVDFVDLENEALW